MSEDQNDERLPYSEYELELGRLLDEAWGKPDPRPRRKLPERWLTLLAAVGSGNVNYETDPNKWSRHKITHFDGVRCCGEGGYGLVFEVFDPRLQRRCALKLCAVGEHQTPDDVLAEAQTLASLSHPNIITVYETGSYREDPADPEDPFFVMEYATGKTAHHFAIEFADEDGPPPWREIVDIYLGAGKGLAHAHKEGVVHGDFKPSNVLIDEGGARPRVADFGFARRRLEHTPEHERDAVRVRHGTIAYAAPEALRGVACDALSDQWSFCASLWHSLEGTLPFDAPTTERMLDTIERTQPQRRNPAVPETLRTVLECGLSPNPRHRFPNMDELLRALELVRETALTPAPISADGELALTVRRYRRRNGPGWGFSVVCLVTAGVSVFAAVRNARPPVLEPTAVVGECAVEPGESLSEDAELREATLGVCRKIRAGRFQQASSDWDEQWIPGDTEVAEATLIVARTFVEAAESIGDRDSEQAQAAALAAIWWADKLGDKYPGVSNIEGRAAPFRRD